MVCVLSLLPIVPLFASLADGFSPSMRPIVIINVDTIPSHDDVVSYHRYEQRRSLISQLQMTTDENISEEEQTLEKKDVSQSDATATKDDSTTTNTSEDTTNVVSNNNKQDKSGRLVALLLLPTLLLKFTVVLVVKFATDVVVYPMLYMYRWARMGKRAVLRGLSRLFGKDGGEKGGVDSKGVNGDSVASSSP
jgi:hypothetical protein